MVEVGSELQTSPAGLLPPRNWHPGNYTALQHWLGDIAAAPAEMPPLAVFDWDNTCIFNDIADATMRYQLEHLQLRLTPAALDTLFFAEIPTLAGPQGSSIQMAALKADICSSYAQLWPAMQAGDGATVRGSAAHRDFVSKFGVLYGAIENDHRLGAATAYPWLLRMFDHFNDDEAADLARAAWAMAAAEPVGRGNIRSATPGHTGILQFDFATHVRLIPEMADLIASLAHLGVQVAIVSASFEPLVRAAAALTEVAVQQAAILGMRRPESMWHGQAYPMTYRQGKVEAIDLGLGRPPVFVAGDANTDYDMLTHYPQTQMRLVIHRPLEGPISSLHRLGLQPNAASSGRRQLLLQGRDEAAGAFWPHQASRPFTPAPP